MTFDHVWGVLHPLINIAFIIVGLYQISCAEAEQYDRLTYGFVLLLMGAR